MKRRFLLLTALCLAIVQAWGQTTLASGTCGAEGDGTHITWTLTSDSTLTLSGEGAVADFTHNTQPWQTYLTTIRTAVVGEGVTGIGDWFLCWCNNLTSVTLPEGLESVGDNFLGWCTGLTSLTLPGGLTSVGDNFLIHCMGLTSLTLPDGLTSVGNYFLYECKGLTSVTLPDGLESAGSLFLYGCTGLQELTAPVATPPVLGGNGAFEGVSNTIPVYVPAGSEAAYKTAAGWSYFTDYRPIPTVVASGTCGAEGDGTHITWTLTDDGTLTLSGTGAVADFELSAQPWQAHLSAIRTAVVGEGVTRIGNFFLYYCTGLDSITLPAGLTGVGEHFLESCESLTSLTLPAGLTSVEGFFLSFCKSLTSLTLPEGLESVGQGFLYGCTGLTSVTLPAGLASVGNYFLGSCTGLEELTVLAATPPTLGSYGAFEEVDHAIPVYVPAGSTEAYKTAAGWDYFTDYRPLPTVVASGTCGAEGDGSNITWVLTSDSTLTLSGTGAVADFKLGAQPWQAHRASIRTAVVGEGVTGIGNNFLYGCPSLDSITLPETLESVGEGFLAYCTSLASLTLPGGLTGIGDGFLSDCESLASVTLPGDVTSVGHGFLYGCTALASVTLPEGLESAGDTFLGGCSSLTSVTLPEGLESVGGGFLVGCRGLTSLTLPAGLTVAGDGFLYGCTGLEELTVRAATPPSIGSEDAFEDVDNAIPVYVPAGSIEAYKTAAVWDYFDTYLPIGTVAHGTCGAEGDGSNIIWYLTADGTLTLSGTGEVAGYEVWDSPWEEHADAIRTAVVMEGVTGIGDNFLSNCHALTSITLPEGLTSVGHGFLSYCESLTSATLPDGLTSVGDGFLCECRGLTSLTLPEGLESVGEGFLIGCRGLTSLTLPDGLKSVGGEFLSSCFGLTSLTLPEGLESIGDVFLGWCTGLTSLTLPEGVKSIGDAFLYGCTGLEELTVRAATPPSIGSEDAFGDVDNAIPVYVPAGSIEAYKTAAVWSYFTDYRPLGNTGIGTPSLAGSVTVAGGEVRLHLAGNPEVHVYDMQGRHVLSTTEHRIALPQGSYIIKVGREAVKVAL